MKVAVYTITKNEEQFVARWAESAQEADVRLIVDTGSTDNTVQVAKASGCTVAEVAIMPWRFDDARNAALALLPADIDWCVALDADEILLPGWREELAKIDPTVTRPSYRYTWSWNADGSPGLVYGGDKIHTRRGYRWKHPVHEALFPSGIEEVRGWCGLEIHHHPDNTKSRSHYLPLLEQAVREDPSDDRNAHYLAREYFYAGRRALAEHEFRRHLDLPKAVWKPERAKSMRLLSKCVDPSEELHWLLRACAEDPDRREQWYELALYYFRTNQWEPCLFALRLMFNIQYRSLDYISESEPWSYLPYDYAARAAFNCGRFNEALEYGHVAASMAPTVEYLNTNLEFYRNALV